MLDRLMESCLREHVGVFCECVGVTVFRRGEHHQAEARGGRRRHTIRIGNKLHHATVPPRRNAACTFFNRRTQTSGLK